MMRSRRITVCLGLALLGLAAVPLAANAQSRVPTVPFVKQVLKTTKGRWISFRNFNGRQLVYFSHLITWKCAMSEVRYSINGSNLDQRWPLPECNPHAPHNIDAKTKIHLTLPPGTARSVSVQVVFKDGSKSAVRSFGPCNVKGDTTCGIPVVESHRAQEKTAGDGAPGGASGNAASGTSAGSSQ